jgi:hypothetical protein
MTHAALAEPTPTSADESAQAPSRNSDSSADLVRIRMRYGFGLIIASFALLGVVFGVAITQFSAAADVATVVGTVTTFLGTFFGAHFGSQAGASGKEAAEAHRARAEEALRVALGKLDPEAAQEVIMKLL